MMHALRWLPSRLRSRTEALGLDVVFVLMTGLALAQGLQTTGDLDWPHDADLFRDIGQAQTILDGDYLADPLYLNESVWYNPLVPTLVAGASRLTDLPVHVVDTRIGAYLNVLAPVCFYALVASFFDRWTALASTFGFLFVIGDYVVGDWQTRSWASASYSPWLFTTSFAQALFYGTLLAYKKAIHSGKRRAYFVVGVLLGLTFLAHTAPYLVMAGILAVFTMGVAAKSWKQEARSISPREAIINFGIVVATSLVVSSPFLYSILGHYHLRIVNESPTLWAYPPLVLENFGQFVEGSLTSRPLLTAIVVVGLIGLVRRQFRSVEGKLLLLWLAISTSLLAYGYAWQVMRSNGVSLPMVIPSFHFLFYFAAMEAILFGYGLLLTSRYVAWLASRLGRSVDSRLSSRSFSPWSGKAILSFFMVVILAQVLPSYTSRYDAASRNVAQQLIPRLDEAAFNWIREHAEPTDVFLSSEEPDVDVGLFVVGAAGRKVVAVNEYFSNPYVDWSARNADRDSMFKYLKEGQHEEFFALASKYAVSYVIVPCSQSEDIDRASRSFLVKEFADDRFCIYRLVSP